MAKSNDDLDKSILNLGVLMERMLDQNQLIMEIVGTTHDIVTSQPSREEFDEVRTDVKVIKSAVTDTSKQAHRQEGVITKLRRKTA